MIVDTCAGPGGWSEGLRALGHREVGLEIDAAACRTRVAAGHATIRCDVSQYPTEPFKGRIKGKLSSPPCQPWSRAGKGLGLLDQPLVHQAVEDLAQGRDTRAALVSACRDKRSILAAEPMRWLHDLRPEWVCMEQVPDVLPLWRQYAEILRPRAILIASRVRDVAAPSATHSEWGGEDLLGMGFERWVHMSDVLDLPDDARVVTRGERKTSGGNDFDVNRPSWALTGRTRSWMLHTNRDQRKDGSRQIVDPYTRPAPSFTTKAGGQWKLRHGSGFERPVAVEEASILQSFPAAYPWWGSKTKQFEQIGNAVPPLLAMHVVAAATGVEVPSLLPAGAAS